MPVSRITIRPDQMDGVPCIRGMQIQVATIVRMIANGMTTTEIIGKLPALEEADVTAALEFAAELAMQPMPEKAQRALSLVEKAQGQATLDADEAMRAAVELTRSVRKLGNG